MPKRQRERKKEEGEYKEPESVGVPKIPYFDRLRREQKVEDRREQVDIEEEPEVTKFPTESVRRKSYALGMVHDGKKWRKDFAEHYAPKIFWCRESTTVGTDSTYTFREVSGAIGELFQYSLKTDYRNMRIIIDRKIYGDLRLPTDAAGAAGWPSVKNIHDEGDETNYLKLTLYDTTNSEYHLSLKRRIAFKTGIKLQVHNPDTAATHDVSLVACAKYAER